MYLNCHMCRGGWVAFTPVGELMPSSDLLVCLQPAVGCCRLLFYHCLSDNQ